MVSIRETAYPCLKSHPTSKDLIEVYTPTPEEVMFAEHHTRAPFPKLMLLVHLKVFQRLGYFLQIRDTPKAILQHIAQHIRIEGLPVDFKRFDLSGTRRRQVKLIREHLGITEVCERTRTFIRRTAEEAAITKDEIADIINIVLEKLAQNSFELPAFSTLSREAQSVRANVNRAYFESITDLLDNMAKAMIDQILSTNRSGQGSTWDAVKQEPKQPTITNVREFSSHLHWLQALNRKLPENFPIQPGKCRNFVIEARSLNVANMNELMPVKRYALAAILIRAQTGRALDDVVDILIKIMRKLHNKASAALKQHQLNRADEVDNLITLLRDLLTAYRSTESKGKRLEAIDSLLEEDSLSALRRCEEHMAFANGNYLPFLLRPYRTKRSVLFDCLESLQLCSTTHDQTIIDSLAFVLLHRRSHKVWLPIENTSLDLSRLPEKWQKMVVSRNARTSTNQVHRHYFELCVFTQVIQELKSGDLFIVGSDQYSDFRDQLVSWEVYDEEIAEYGSLVGIETDPTAFVINLKALLSDTALTTDKTFPDNDQVSIENGRPVIRKKPKSALPKGLARIEAALDEHLPQTNILDALIDTERWLNLSSGFRPLSGHETKLSNHQERFVATLFCYGCNLGLTQTARSVQGFNRRQISWLNLRHVTEEKLDDAITRVVNAYNVFELPKHWGSGSSASADGTKWDVYEQNLLSEWHIRYAGRGGLGYYVVSDTYIALFSHFIPCGVYEAIYILDVLQKNRSEIQPDTLHGDTHSQSEVVFGLAYLLGIKLMPRIRSIRRLKFYRATRKTVYKYIDELFRDSIRFALVERHLPDLLRVAVSIKNGNITPSTILRRLGTYSRKNKLYFALRELGRAVRTVFLLQYIAVSDLRRMIQAATCKSEEFNGFLQWVMFGGDGVIAENLRHEQRKIIKYNHLAANLLILHNVATMTRTLGELIQQGHAVDDELLAKLSPFRRGHINRFGSYIMNMERKVEPMEYHIQRLS